MKTFNNIRQSIKMFGLLGLMAALTAGFASAPAAPASAAAADLAGKLSIFTLDQASTPVANATVLVLNGSAQRVAKVLTGSDGNVRIKLEAGEYKVVISADNFKEFSQMAQVKAGAVTTLKAALTSVSAISTTGSTGAVSSPSTDPGPLPTGKLSVQVLDPAGNLGNSGIAGATVLVTNGSGRQVAKGLTNSQGLFEAKLTSGEYKVTISADNFKEFSQVTGLTANEVTTVKAELQAVATITN